MLITPRRCDSAELFSALLARTREPSGLLRERSQAFQPAVVSLSSLSHMFLSTLPTETSSAMSLASNHLGGALNDDTPAALVGPLEALPPSSSETSSLDGKHDVEKAYSDVDEKLARQAGDVLEANELSPMEAFAVNVDGDQSPFAEVAACVPNTDDPDLLISSVSLSVCSAPPARALH